MWCTHTHTHTHTPQEYYSAIKKEYYSAIKKEYYSAKIMPFAATWMDLETIILSEVSQTETDKYHMIPLTCGI